MNTSPVTVNRNLVVLARMLDRLERSPGRVDPEQFRVVVARVTAELEASPRDAGLDAVLATYPAWPRRSGNLNYGQAGLCRSALATALAGGLAARAAIEAARHS